MDRDAVVAAALELRHEFFCIRLTAEKGPSPSAAAAAAAAAAVAVGSPPSRPFSENLEECRAERIHKSGHPCRNRGTRPALQNQIPLRSFAR